MVSYSKTLSYSDNLTFISGIYKSMFQYFGFTVTKALNCDSQIESLTNSDFTF